MVGKLSESGLKISLFSPELIFLLFEINRKMSNDIEVFTWRCTFCQKCYLRSHDWVFNRYQEYVCKFCNQKLNGNPDAPLAERQKLIEECSQELQKQKCTRETCGPLLPSGECVYHGETKRTE